MPADEWQESEKSPRQARANRWVRRAALVVVPVLASSLFTMSSASVAASTPHAGDADPTWGSGGTSADLPNGGQQLAVPAGAALHDGSLVVVTSQGLMRLNAAGVVDPTYGTHGKVTLPFTATSVAGEDNNDVIAVGGTPGSYETVRLLPSGHLDPSWGTGGTTATGDFGAFPYLDPSGALVLQKEGSPPSIERLNSNGALDHGFGGGHPVVLTGLGAAGPITAGGAQAGYVMASETCALPAACPFDIVEIGADGTVGAKVTAQSAPSPTGEFRPEAISTALSSSGVLVIGGRSEALVRSNGSLDPAFGQGRCGDPGDLPPSAGGTLHLLADGRTVDLNAPGVGGLYDIIPHVFVHDFGRKDVTFGDGGHTSLPTFDRTAVFLASTGTAVWFALEDPATGGSTSIVKLLLAPGADPVRFGPPATSGSWLISSDGGVIAVASVSGTSPEFCGSMGATPLAQPVVGGAVSPDGVGYWLVAADGGIFSFGDAAFFGSTGATRLNQPIVGMASTPDGNGYWLVARDGGVFSFGDATFFGSTGGMRLNQPIVAMSPTADGRGYWLAAADGGIFTFGDATFLGSLGAVHLNAPVVGILRTRSGNGYWLAARDGGTFTFGDAGFGDVHEAGPIVGIASAPPDTYTVVTAGGMLKNSDFGPLQQSVTPAHPIVGIISQG